MKVGIVIPLFCLAAVATLYRASITRSATITNRNVPSAKRRDQLVPPIFRIVVNNTHDSLFDGLNISANAAQTGMWSSVNNWHIVAIHAAILPDGRLLTFGSPTGVGVQDGRTFVFWDPKEGVGNGIITAPNAQNVDSFCAAGVLLRSGKFFAAGGAAPVTSYTGTETTIVDPATSSAVNGVSTLVPRWYSTMTSLPDGRKIITGGGVPFFGESSTTPEVYTEGEGWQHLPGAKSEDAFGTTNYHFWYPRQWVTPSGSVFGISTEKMWEMQVGGNGTIRTMFTFKGVPNNASLPNVGPTSTAVMYDIGKIIQVGGNGLNNDYQSISSAAATTFDINSIGSGKVMFKDVAPMHNARQWSNSIVLPDGKVLVTGGSTYADHAGENAVLAAELCTAGITRCLCCCPTVLCMLEEAAFLVR